MKEIPVGVRRNPGVYGCVHCTYSLFMAGKTKGDKLTESEGRVLALLARLETPTAYSIYATLAGSPTGELQASKGTIYPIIERLKARGLIEATRLPRKGSGAESLEVTAKGTEAIRKWITDIGPEHILVYDPLRSRIPALQFLSSEERLEWLTSVKRLNQEKVDQVDAYQGQVEMSFEAVVHAAAFYALWGQSKWLDKLLIELVENPKQIRPTRIKVP